MENMTPESPKTPRVNTSPATSTPGQHIDSPIATLGLNTNSPAKIVKSELSESDESAVYSSEETTVEHNTVYEKSLEDTTIQELTSDHSCVASRTRPKSSTADTKSEI